MEDLFVKCYECDGTGVSGTKVCCNCHGYKKVPLSDEETKDILAYLEESK